MQRLATDLIIGRIVGDMSDGGYAISDDIVIPGEGTSDFIVARGWLLEIVEIRSGDYCFISDGEKVGPLSGRFGAFYPPFTFIRCHVRDVKGRVRGVGSEKPLPELPDTPCIFETNFAGDFSATAQAAEVLRDCRDRRSIEVNPNASLLSLKVRRLIDRNYAIYPSISRIAARLKVSPEHLSRQFKKDYGLSPSEYLHQIRGADAVFRLSTGQPIIDISAEVGYNDLSRFYKQFHKQYGMPPGRCRSAKFE